MHHPSIILTGALLAGALAAPLSAARSACPPGNAAVPPGANTTDRAAPFFIDTAGMTLSAAPPVRDPANPAYPRARELPDGQLPPAGAEGNFVIGPTHSAAPEMAAATGGAPKGAVTSLRMTSTEGVAYNPGLIRDDTPGCRNASIITAQTAPGDPSNLIVTTSHAGVWTRAVDVYVPAQYVRGSEAPFIVFGDGGPHGFIDETKFFGLLDALIAQHRLPPMVAIGIANGGQDAQGSERGLEYDTVSGAYAEWVEGEVLPRVERQAGVRLTHDPDGRATMGISSSGAAAFTMAWFHPELYHRVLAYSPTMVNQQWPHNPALPGGAWEYHDRWPGSARPDAVAATGAPLIPSAPAKPIRFWFEVGDQDLFYPLAVMPDGMHDWVLSAERMAAVLADKGYHYQFVFARNARHVDKPTVAQTLPAALEWLWQGYPAR